MELKRIEAIQALEKKLNELTKLIPVYKARFPAYEHVLADHIINLELQLISVKSNNPLPNQPESHPTVLQPHAPESIQSNDIAEIFTYRPRQIPNLYWQQGQPFGAPVRTFRQIKYLPLPNAMPDLDQALSGARLDCEWDLHKQLIEYGGAAKVWMTVQVEYEPVNPLGNKEPFVQYLSAAPTRIFSRDGQFSAFANPYIDSLVSEQIGSGNSTRNSSATNQAFDLPEFCNSL